jgi:hypothetical protein
MLANSMVLLNLKRFELQLKLVCSHRCIVNISKSNHRLSIPEMVPVNAADDAVLNFKRLS